MPASGARLRRPLAASGQGTVAGIALAVLGAVGFATKGVFAKLLYADGWTFETTLATRAVLSLPVMAVWAYWRAGPMMARPAPWPALLGAAAAGSLCYYVGAMLDFYALTELEVGVERVLLFAYPSIVVLLYAIAYRQMPRPRVLAAVVVAYAGILLVVSGFDLRLLQANLTGSGLVLGCSLTMAVYYLASDRWTGPLGSVKFTLCALTAAASCLAVHYLVRHGFAFGHWQARDVALMGGLVVFATVVPMLAMAESVRRLGAERAAVVSTVGPPATLLLGAWLLGEHLLPAQWLGVVLIVAGILILEGARRPELTRRAARAVASGGSAYTRDSLSRAERTPISDKTAFVLAGGGSLGAVQVGMLAELARVGVHPDLIVGVSAGALNGAFLAHDPSAAAIETMAVLWSRVRTRDIIRLSPGSLLALLGLRSHFVDASGLHRLLEAKLPYRNFAAARVPLHVVAADQRTGEEVVLDSGDLIPAVLASTAIPGVFPPVPLHGRMLVDGVVATGTPIATAVRLGATRLVILPCGFTCVANAIPRHPVGRAMHALTLLGARQLRQDFEHYSTRAQLHLVPPLCPLAQSSYDYSNGQRLVDAARASTRSWLEDGGLARCEFPEQLRVHSHRSPT